MQSMLYKNNGDKVYLTLPYQNHNSSGDYTNIHWEQTCTKEWIEILHKHFIKIRYDNKLKNIILPYKNFNEGIYTECNEEIQNAYFIRLENCSARDSKYLIIKSINDISKCIETSERAQAFIKEQDEEKSIIDIYLIPFNYNIHNNKKYEFRAMVNNGKITAIGQYYRNKTYTIEEINSIIPKCINMIKDFIPKFGPNSFIIDLFLMPDNECIIETNPFGIHSSTGLVLFDWKTDYLILHGKTDYIDVRFIIEN